MGQERQEAPLRVSGDRRLNFLDVAKVFAKAGTGGDGGKGGDIVLVADNNLSTLMDVSRNPHLRAGDGNNGKGSMKTGADAADLVVRVPIGTVIYRNSVPLADLVKAGDRITVAKGGRGGHGNLWFKTHKNTAPRIAEKGEPGEEAEIQLELKLIADVGLAGFPNAGKSSLLSRVSNARPKVADYPFTTLNPHLGVVHHKERSFVMADIPGLIEGAHAGKGLGDDFLRHIERTRVLVQLIDPMGFGRFDPVAGVKAIEDEIKKFSPDLATKPRALVVNKMDLPEGEAALKKIKARYRTRKVFAISAATGEGVSKLLDFLISELAKTPKDEGPVVPEGRVGVRVEKVEPGFRAERVAHGEFRVTGKNIERMAAMCNMGQWESVERFQRTMKRIGVDKALKRLGVHEGDTVHIGPVQLEWAETIVKTHQLVRRRD